MPLGGHADNAAQGVEYIYKEEGEHHCQKIEGEQPGEVHLHKGGGQAGDGQTGGEVGQDAGHAQLGVGDIEAGELTEDGRPPHGQDAQQQGAPHPADGEDGGEEDSGEGQRRPQAHGAHLPGGDGLPEGVDRQHGGGVGHDQLGVLKADEEDEQADAPGDAQL